MTDLTFLMVARVLYDKGYSEYAEAGDIIRKKFPWVKVELLGPMDVESPMGVPQEVVDQDVSEGKIDYLGVTNDVPSYLRRPHVVVVVVSSYHEGLNRSLMEACAMGKPIITTNIPGCREAVEEGENGFLVPQKDANALAEAMQRFIGMTEEGFQKMEQASHRRAVDRFDVQRVLRKYDSIVEQIIHSN